MNSIDYGLIALFALQGLILVGVAWLFARLTNKIERLQEAEMTFKHLSKTLDDKVDKLDKGFDSHKAKIKEQLAQKLDYEVGDDKLRSELRSLNSKFSLFKKKIESGDVDDDVEPEIQPGTVEQIQNGSVPAHNPAQQDAFPGFGAIA